MVASERLRLNKHSHLDSDERIYFDIFDADARRTRLDTQHHIIDYMKKKSYTQLFQNLKIIVDFADGPTCIRRSTCSIRSTCGPDIKMISTITAAQHKTRDPPIIKHNATEPCICRLRRFLRMRRY